MPFLFERAYRRLGKSYFLLYVAFEFASAIVVCLATLGLFSLYTDPDPSEFWTIVAFAEGCVILTTAFMMWNAARRVRPIVAWMEDQGGAMEAWQAAVEVPRDLTVKVGWQPFLLIGVPVSVFATIEADLLPGVHHLRRRGRGRSGTPRSSISSLGALPLINVITGVVVSGLSTNGDASLHDLGLDAVLAVLVAFTISPELTVLVTRSVLQPVDSLLEVSRRRSRRARADSLGRRDGPAGRQLQREDKRAVGA